MADFRYLIVGGGMTAAAAVEGLREVDQAGPIAIIGQEDEPPYKRPPLTKGLWKGEALDDIRLDLAPGVTLMLGRTVKHLDLARRTVTDDHGDETGYEKLLLATGGQPRRLPSDGGRVNYYRRVSDYRSLRRDAQDNQLFGVIGGGFIGSEIAAALAMNGKQVVLIFPGDGIGANVYPRDLALFLNDYYRQHGVEVMTNSKVVGIEPRGDQTVIRTQSEAGGNEDAVLVDRVVAGLGIAPGVELALEAGLAVDNGIVVDRFLQTTKQDVFAAGDVAAFESPALGRRIRVEHEDNANTMGRVAGLNMAGRETPYEYLPSFYSDLFDLGYEAVGSLDSRLETVSVWDEPYTKGVVYYLMDGLVRGVLLWNVWEQVDAARRLIAGTRPLSRQDLEKSIQT